MSSFERCRDFWDGFDLVTVQRVLYEAAGDIAKRQDEAEAGRKRLIEMSKEFKRTAPDETRKCVAPLMKAFQGEIDSLTKRSKGAEASFLSLYRKIGDAPDPTPVLDQALANRQKLSSMTDLELEKKQLRETLEQYNLQFAQYKSQDIELSALRKRLEDVEEDFDRQVHVRLTETKDALVKDFQFKESQLKESNTELALKADESGVLLAKLQQSLETAETELFELKSRYEEDIHTKNAEIELYLSDLDIANQRLNQSGHIIETIQQSSSKEHIDGEISDLKARNRLMDVEVKNKESEIIRLVEETHGLQTELAKKDSELRSRSTNFDQELARLRLVQTEVQAQLTARKDYEEIKKELGILRSIEFGETDHKDKSLEVLLLEKNKTLQAENSNLRLEVHNTNTKLTGLQNDMEYIRSDSEEKAALVKQLEEDLTQLQAHRVRGDGDGEPSLVVKSTESLIKEQQQEQSPGNMDMLAIVTSQRERFRAKCEVIENDYNSLKTSYAVLQQDNSTLRNDNMKLYERIKFLQTVATATPNTPENNDDITHKYSSQYEAQLDPFSAFNKREKQRKYAALSSAERVTLGLGKMILSDKIARNGVFFYTIALHLLVFVVLYKFAVSEDCMQLSDCNEAYQAHMRDHHP